MGRRLVVLTALAIAVLAFALTFREDPSADTWFHLAAGRRIVEELRLPRTNEFLAFERDHPFVDHEWLFQAGAWLVYRAGGETGIGLAKLALVFATFACLALALRRQGVGALVALVPALLLAESRFLARPELASMLGVAWTLLLLERDRERETRANLLLAFAGQVLWVNAHGFAMLGPLVTLAAMLGGRRARLARLAAAQTAGLLVNPFFLVGAFFPVVQVARALADWRSGGIALRIVELQSPFTAALADVFEVRLLKLVLVLAAGLATLGFVLRRRGAIQDPMRLDHLGVGFLLAASAYLWLRNLPFAAIGTAPVIADGVSDLGRALARWRPERVALARRAALAATAVVSLLGARAALGDQLHANAQYDARAGFGLSDFLRYRDAVAFLDASPPAGKLFNNFGAGHYLIFARDRREPLPYVCGLTELYSREFLVEYHAVVAGETPYAPVFEARGVTDALLDHRVEVSRDLIVALASDPAWRIVHLDSHAVLFRRGAARGIDLAEVARVPERFFGFADESRADPWLVRVLRAMRLVPARAPAPLERLHAASFLDALGRREEALLLARRALELAPGSPPALFILASLERTVDPAAAERHALELAKAIPSAPYPHVSAGLAALAAGAPRRAVAHFERALALDPAFELAYRNLPQAYVACDPPDLVALKRALVRFPLPPEWRAYWEGQAADAESDPARAEACYRKALEARPSFTVARFYLGNALAARGAFAEAATAYEEVVRAQPADGQAFLNLGLVRQRLGLGARSEEALRRAAELMPRDARALVVLGRDALERGDVATADRLAREARKRDPRSAQAEALVQAVRRRGG